MDRPGWRRQGNLKLTANREHWNQWSVLQEPRGTLTNAAVRTMEESREAGPG
jgi:hypothetical protein